MLCVLETALAVPTPCAGQDRAELQVSSDDADREARKLDSEDAALVRLLHDRADDLGFDNHHVAVTEELIKEWRVYTIRECALVGQVTGGKPIPRDTYAQMCQERRFTARIPVVSGVVKCLSGELKKPFGDRQATECLTTLTPLRDESDYWA